MTIDAERAAIVALVRRGGHSWPEVADGILRVGSAVPLLNGEDSESGQGSLFAAYDVDEELSAAARDIEQWSAEGLKLVTVLDDDYPFRLRLVREQPPFLFARGSLADDEQAIAVVGTRHPSPRGLEHAQAVASGLAEQGVTVVSGLAAGVDTAAHTAALAAGGRTVAVIGTGLRRAYPAANAALQQTIGERGLVLSQFWPDSPPTKYSFPLRNAVMSGYSLATVVIEAANRSGARMQARMALEHGRRVFLMQSLLEHEWARAYAARPNTTVITGPDDVLRQVDALRPVVADELRWS